MTIPSSFTLDTFNAAGASVLAARLRACAPIDPWIRRLVDARPFSRLEELMELASRSARDWTDEEVLGALAHHPRIGERAKGLSAAETAHSAAEQSGVEDADAWVEANARYEDRFGTVFLIRAAGRSQTEMLAELERRLQLDDEQEQAERAEQLRQIALLRLSALVVG